MSRILVVDDEANVLAAFEEILGGLGHEVLTARHAEAALERLQAEPLDLIILDICLPGMNGLDALAQIKRLQPRLPVIVMTGQGTMETAVEATKRGAFDYHLKPFEPSEMLRTIDKALEGLRLMNNAVALGCDAPAPAGDAIIGRCSVMQEMFKAIGRVAETNASVLIRGESGTGKELVARTVYQHSLRHDAPLMVVNCAAIPETLLESELFGYEKGAFTGAVARRIGKFEQAHGGTIFLDEVGDVPLGIQMKILRVLQERTFQRLGGNDTIHSDARVLAATNRDLEKAVAEGRFRTDLYHRLNVVTLQVPALRQRRDDIRLLVSYFLDRFARELEVERLPISEEALVLLENYAWPGNVRELEHCIHRAMIFTRGHPIQAADLPLPAASKAGGPLAGPAEIDESVLGDVVERYLSEYYGQRAYEQLMETIERLLLTDALRRTRGNQTHAARLLGLPRPTFHAKMQKHGLRDLGEPGGP